MPADEIRLAEELKTYENNRIEWLKEHAGEFVVIMRSQQFGFYPTFDGALKAGLDRFGYDSEFMVKEVTESDPVCVVY